VIKLIKQEVYIVFLLLYEEHNFAFSTDCISQLSVIAAKVSERRAAVFDKVCKLRVHAVTLPYSS